MAHGVIALRYLYVKVQQGDVMSCLSDFTFLRCDFVQHLQTAHASLCCSCKVFCNNVGDIVSVNWIEIQ